MSVTIILEKGEPLTISDWDENFLEIRNVINSISMQTSNLLNEENNVIDIINNINSIQNNNLKISNNLNDLVSYSVSNDVLDIYSKTNSDDLFFNTNLNLTNFENKNEVIENINIGTNSFIDSYIVKLTQHPEPEDGENGDIWFDYGILITQPGQEI